MGGPQAVLTLASTSPQRRAILEQLAIPFEAVAPDYVEHDPPDADPEELVGRHAEGKARSVHGEGRITLGVDTTVVLDRRVYGKARDAADAARMLAELKHEVGRLVVETTGAVIGRVLTPDDHRRLNEETAARFTAS
jgi:septum formation protein